MSEHWTDARVEQLKQLWAEGLSASQCARVIGGVTRNAVIGKIHRMGLAGRAGPPRQERSRSFKRAAAPIEEPIPDNAPDPMVDQGGKRFTIETIRDHLCKWPYGDPALPDFHLCGHPTITLSPYCAHHARKAFAPGYVRARKDEAAEELSVIFKAERVFA